MCGSLTSHTAAKVLKLVQAFKFKALDKFLFEQRDGVHDGPFGSMRSIVKNDFAMIFTAVIVCYRYAIDMRGLVNVSFIDHAMRRCQSTKGPEGQPRIYP